MALFPVGEYLTQIPDIPASAFGWQSVADRNAALHVRVLELEALLAVRDETIRGDACRMMTMGTTIADLERRLVDAARQISTLDASLADARAAAFRARRPVEPVPNAWLPERPGVGR